MNEGHCIRMCICNPLSRRRQGSSEIYATGIPVRRRSRVAKVKQFCNLDHRRLRPPQFCSVVNGDKSAYCTSDVDSSSADHRGGSTGKNETGQGESLTSFDRLRRYGIAGLLSYGLLNTAYYLVTFLLVWFYVAPVPGRMGYLAAAKRFLSVMAMVWAGSQVTKLVRVGGALALAPFVDKGLSWFTAEFNFESQGEAFLAVVSFCLGLAVLMFFVVTLLWA